MSDKIDKKRATLLNLPSIEDEGNEQTKPASEGGSVNSGDQHNDDKSESASQTSRRRIKKEKKRVREYEVRRASTKRSRIAVAIITVIILALAAILIAFYVTVDENNRQREKAITSIQSAIENIVAADEIVVPLDNAIYEQVGSDSQFSMAEELEDTSTTDQLLNDALKNVDEALTRESYLTEEYREVAHALKDSAEGRQEMLSVGRVLVAADIEASSAKQKLGEAYEAMLQADASIRAGAALATEVEVEGEINIEKAEQVVEYDRAALDSLTQAQDLTLDAVDDFNGIDATSLLDYLQKRIEAVNLLLAADQAIVSEDFEKAAEYIGAYNTLDAEVVKLAQNLPEDSKSFVAEAYREETEEQRATYRNARTLASNGDAVVRAYQGQE